jgi:hypothetical protein
VFQTFTSRTKTEKESESVIAMCDRMQMYNIGSAYYTLKMEAICSSETSIDFQRTKRCSLPKHRTTRNHWFIGSIPTDIVLMLKEKRRKFGWSRNKRREY